jgi:hypothetical protein
MPTAEDLSGRVRCMAGQLGVDAGLWHWMQVGLTVNVRFGKEQKHNRFPPPPSTSSAAALLALRDTLHHVRSERLALLANTD